MVGLRCAVTRNFFFLLTQSVGTIRPVHLVRFVSDGDGFGETILKEKLGDSITQAAHNQDLGFAFGSELQAGTYLILNGH